MSQTSGLLLLSVVDEAYESLYARLAGLTDEEFFWEPVPGCWSVRQDQQGVWKVDYELPEPDPAPLTTIGWRLVHVATCKIMYHEHAFGPRRLTWDNLEYPHTAADAITLFEEGHKRLKYTLMQLSETDMGKMVFTNWGEEWPIYKIFWTMASHDLHHGGEIGCLRDFYRATHPAHR